MRYLVLPIVAFMLFLSCKSNSTGSGDDFFGFEPAFPCVDGLADEQYACENIDLYSVVTPRELFGLSQEEFGSLSQSQKNGLRLNDIWGWKDPQTEKEYALVGLVDGVTFVDVTNPLEPVVIGKLDESNISAKYKVLTDPNYEACKVGIGDTEQAKSIEQGSTWRDHKVFNDHLYIGSDAQPHGIQVFDLSKLRTFDGIFLEFQQDALYSGVANSHNVVINEESGFAYAVGATNADTCATAGLHIIDINDPKNPVFAGCYEDKTPPRRIGRSDANGAYIHDAQCVNYTGPDSDYTGREVCFGAAERSLVIADVTEKDSTITLGFATDPNMSYAHQGWLTEDQSYFLMNDELDEYNIGRTTKTYIFDVRDLENPTFVNFYEHNTESIDHNLYVKDDLVYASNYISGLRVLRINDIGNADLSLEGFFDSEPREFTEPNREFQGTWSNYPYFESGTIIMSDITRGLFILKSKID